MFDRNLVDLLTTSKPVEVASCLNDEQIRSILPSLLWLGLQQSPKTHRLPVSAELLRVVSRFHDVETIIELFRIDFPNLNLEIERLQRIKEKSLGDGQTTNNAIIHQEIVGFEQSSPRDRSRLIAQVLLDPLQNDVPLVLSKLSSVVLLWTTNNFFSSLRLARWSNSNSIDRGRTLCSHFTSSSNV